MIVAHILVQLTSVPGVGKGIALVATLVVEVFFISEVMSVADSSVVFIYEVKFASGCQRWHILLRVGFLVVLFTFFHGLLRAVKILVHVLWHHTKSLPLISSI